MFSSAVLNISMETERIVGSEVPILDIVVKTIFFLKTQLISYKPYNIMADNQNLYLEPRCCVTFILAVSEQFSPLVCVPSVCVCF